MKNETLKNIRTVTGSLGTDEGFWVQEKFKTGFESFNDVEEQQKKKRMHKLNLFFFNASAIDDLSSFFVAFYYDFKTFQNLC